MVRGMFHLASALAVATIACGAVPVPTAAQLRYQQQELVALTHFNVSIGLVSSRQCTLLPSLSLVMALSPPLRVAVPNDRDRPVNLTGA